MQGIFVNICSHVVSGMEVVEHCLRRRSLFAGTFGEIARNGLVVLV